MSDKKNKQTDNEQIDVNDIDKETLDALSDNKGDE